MAAAHSGALSACGAAVPVPQVVDEETSGRQSGSVCSAVPLDRVALELAGRPTYVEPQGFSTAGGSTLLVGQPTYEWSPPDSSGRTVIADENRILGVVLTDRGAKEIRIPVEGRPTYLRVAPRGDAAWALLMAEVDTTTSLAGGITRLWYGELDGTEWSNLSPVPVPAEGRLLMFNSSELRLLDGRARWVAALSAPTGNRLLYFERRPDGEWTHETVLEGEIEALTLERAAAGLVLGVSRLEPQDGAWVHALTLFDLSEGAERAERAVPPSRIATVGPEEYIRGPVAARMEGGLALSWIAEWNLDDGFHRSAQATVLVGPRAGGEERSTVDLDPFAVQTTPVRLPDGSLLWVVDHMDPSGAQSIRLLRAGPEGPVEVGGFPNPFTGYFAVAPAADEAADFIMVGPQFDPEPGHVTVRSLFIRVKNTCR